MRTFHSLSIILVLIVIIGLLASFSEQTVSKNNCFIGIAQEKAPNILLQE